MESNHVQAAREGWDGATEAVTAGTKESQFSQSGNGFWKYSTEAILRHGSAQTIIMQMFFCGAMHARKQNSWSKWSQLQHQHRGVQVKQVDES